MKEDDGYQDKSSPVMEAVSLPIRWPQSGSCAVSLTFDVDGVAVFRHQWDQYAWRLSTVSEREFGIHRGMPRILRLLERRGLCATFFVPGCVAELYPAVIARIVEAGHEIASHGYLHLSPEDLTPDAQRTDVHRSLEAIQRVSGDRPYGYRAPSWALTTQTLTELIRLGLRYDSSCMGDDRPYHLRLEEGRILELPVHWSLDDWPYLGSRFSGPTGRLVGTDGMLQVWKVHLASALSERSHVTYTMHPEVIGRAHGIAALDSFVESLLESGAWVAGLGDVAIFLQQAVVDRSETDA
jgi:peptidoglycan/xylan/chitin deacetylase (PgdA/CDA1 family)